MLKNIFAISGHLSWTHNAENILIEKRKISYIIDKIRYRFDTFETFVFLSKEGSYMMFFHPFFEYSICLGIVKYLLVFLKVFFGDPGIE